MLRFMRRVTSRRASTVGAAAQSLRICSCCAFSGQPNQALRPVAAWPVSRMGLDVALPPPQVKKMFQPPWSGGFWFERRATTPPQSEEASCTLKPTCRRFCATTRMVWFMMWMSVACSSVMGLPS